MPCVFLDQVFRPKTGYRALYALMKAPMRRLDRPAAARSIMLFGTPMDSAAGVCFLRNALVPTDDGSDVFAAQCWFQQMRLEPVDYLKLLHLASAGKKID